MDSSFYSCDSPASADPVISYVTSSSVQVASTSSAVEICMDIAYPSDTSLACEYEVPLTLAPGESVQC